MEKPDAKDFSPVANTVIQIFLSEQKGIENVLYRYIQYAFEKKHTVENDFSNTDVAIVQQMSRKVHRENTAWRLLYAFKN